MKRAILVVVDSMGVGAMDDAPKYNDIMECNTLKNVASFNGGLNLPNFQKLGMGNIEQVKGVAPCAETIASYGKMLEVSEGKDTTTGHWEMAGLILEKPFKTYPEGFPEEINDEFIRRTGCKGILGNKPASGTAIIDELAKEHIETGMPIIYTSADSVYQIAVHVDVTPLNKLYEYCKVARELLNGDYNVSRVIARPFQGKEGAYKRLSAARRDYSVAPTSATVLNNIEDQNGSVVGIGKIEDIFVQSGVTHAVHTGSNKEGLELTLKAVKKELDLDEIKIKKIGSTDKEFVFTNLVDTDMLYGHRNDPKGYAAAIEEIDTYLPSIMEAMSEDDLLIITADHGCDPTTQGTDHTREMVPVFVYNKQLEAKDLGLRKTFADIAYTVAEWMGVEYKGPGSSLLNICSCENCNCKQ